MVERVNNDQPVVRDTTIIVPKGRTLSEIAIEFGTSVEELKKLNGLHDVNDIKAGQSLFVKIDEEQRQYNREMAEAREKYDRRIDAERQELQELGLVDEDGHIKDREAAREYYTKKDLKEGRLKFVPEGRFLLLFKTPAHYEYVSQDPKMETYSDLKRRYNIPDGVLKSANPNIDGYFNGNLDIAPLTHSVDIPLEYMVIK